jgi:hypothetical protein
MKTDINKFIKMVYNKSLLIILFLMTVLFTQSCSNQLEMFSEDTFNETQNEETVYSFNVDMDSLTFKTWEEQLNYLINEGEGFDYITKQGLKLIEYKLLQEGVKDKTSLSNESMIPLYNDQVNYNKFEIVSLYDALKFDPARKDAHNDFKNMLLNKYEDTELNCVQLTWLYKNRTFTTICSVTDEKVVYDDLLANIYVISISQPDIQRATPRLKTNSEADGAITYTFNSPPCNVYSIIGSATASVTVFVFGTRSNNKNSIDDYRPTKHSSTTGQGCTAHADYNILGFQSGPNGFCNFEWEVSAAIVSPIPGRSISAGSTERVTPSMLQ